MVINYEPLVILYAKQIKGGLKKIEDVPSNLQSLTLEKLEELGGN